MSQGRHKEETEIKKQKAILMKAKLIKTTISSSLFSCALVSLVAVMALSTSGTARADRDWQSVCGPHTLRGSHPSNPHAPDIATGAAQPIPAFQGIDFNAHGTPTPPFATPPVNALILHFPPPGT